MLNPNTEKQKVRAYNQFIRLLTRLENQWTNPLTKTILDEYKAMASSVRSGKRNVNTVLKRFNARLRASFAAQYRKTWLTFGKLALDEIQQFLKADSQVFYEELEEYIRTYTAMKVTKVQETTKKALQLLIDKGMQAGLSNNEIAKNITTVGSIASKKRALRIVKTETHSAAVHAFDRATASAGLNMEGEWRSAMDARTRKTHLAASGQRRKQGKKYRVGGEWLRFPGDPEGSAKNIIHCRCILLYHVLRKAAKNASVRKLQTRVRYKEVA